MFQPYWFETLMSPAQFCGNAEKVGLSVHKADQHMNLTRAV